MWRYAPDLAFWLVALALHGWMAWRLSRNKPAARALLLGGLAVSALWISSSVVFSINRFANMMPPDDWLRWMRGLGLLWGLLTVGAFSALLASWALRLEDRFQPERRHFFRVTQGAIVASPAILTGFGVYSARNEFHVKEVDIPIPGLPKDLQGLRLVQLSDIHMSPFLTAPDLRRVVDMANETRPHIALVTGDLITGPHDPLEECLLELSRLKADAGVLGCLGNHEVFADCEAKTKQMGADLGMSFLRQESLVLKFGGARLNIAGVDYQPFKLPYLVGAENLVQPGMTNLLMSHNPDVFPVAAQKGFDFTIAGHTHGGQMTVEILHQYLNVARFFTPYVYGHYQKDKSALYVTRGIGTVGIPARIGAPPEITLIRLCAA